MPTRHQLTPEGTDMTETPDTPNEQLAEARMWARHGYELGQRSCTWADHGVAPAWLTEGWPIHFPGPVDDTEPGPAEAQAALSWAESIASHGTGPTATVDIDVDVPGQPEPQPMEIPLEAARVLYAMLGDLLAEHAPDPDRRAEYTEAIHATSVCEVGDPISCGGNCVDAADAVLNVRDTELQQLRDQVAARDGLLGEAVDWIHEGELRERICAVLDGRAVDDPEKQQLREQAGRVRMVINTHRAHLKLTDPILLVKLDRAVNPPARDPDQPAARDR